MKTKYQCFEGDKPADTTGYPDIPKGLGLDNSQFNTFVGALSYIKKWINVDRLPFSVKTNVPFFVARVKFEIKKIK